MKLTKEDIKKSQKCPPGTFLATVITIEEPYFNEKGTKIEKVEFETDAGHIVPYWFNDKMLSSYVGFIEAVDDTKLADDIDVDLKDYKGKKVAISVSHQKNKDGKINSQIDNFFSTSKVPF